MFLTAWLMATCASASDYKLWVTFSGDHDTPAAQLGAPLTLWLHYQGPADLDRIDTTPWNADFHVARGYAQRIDLDQRLRLRITPRRLGKLALPPLRLGGAQSQRHTVQVTPADEAGDILKPAWKVSHPHAWQGEEIRATLTVTAGKTARLTLDGPHWPGANVVALPAQQMERADGRTDYRFDWLLRPREAGTQTVVAPVLRYVVDGVPRRRFHFPDLSVPVQPLPTYVTPTLPVGDLLGGAHGQPIIALGVPAARLLAALQRAGLRGEVAQTETRDLGTRSEARISAGWDDLRAAGLVYFDPQLGRLRALHPTPPGFPWPFALLVGVLLIAAGWAIWRRRRLVQGWALWRYRRRLACRLCRTGTAHLAATALLATPVPGTGRTPLTVSQWLCDYIGQRPRCAARLTPVIRALDQARFGNGDWDAVQREALREAL